MHKKTGVTKGLKTDTCTSSTLALDLAEQLDEAAMAVGLVILFFKSAFVELLETEGADKVLGVELLGHGRDAASGDGLLAAGAEGAAPLVVMNLAVRLTVVLEEAAVYKRGEALPADKTLWMPKTIQRRNVVLQNGSSTSTTFGCKHVKIILPAKGLSILFMKTFRAKKRSTLGTEEVLWMPCPIQRRYHFIEDRPVAVVATRGEQVVIVLLTVRLSLTFKEIS